MGTPKGIQRPFPFGQALSLDEHVVQHTCGARFLSWSLTFQPKYKKYVFFIVVVIEKTSLRQMSLLRKYS